MINLKQLANMYDDHFTYEEVLDFLQCSQHYKHDRIKKSELVAISNLVENVSSIDNDYSIFENFYLNFKVAKLGKEFDLLKIGDKTLLNIELKSKYCIDNMKDQDNLNRYYLKFINLDLKIYFYCSDTNKFYKFIDSKIKEVQTKEVHNILLIMENNTTNTIDSLFNSIEYSISPFNDAHMFLNKNYLLTSEQYSKKINIIEYLLNEKNVLIEGQAGTGKSLLLLDVLYELSSNKKILYINGVDLTEGHNILQKKIDTLDVISIEDLSIVNIKEYDLIAIDETQYIDTKLFKQIISTDNQFIVSIDNNQLLAKNRNTETNSYFFTMLKDIKIVRMHNNLRTSPSLAFFCRNIFNRRLTPKIDTNINLSSVDILYASSINDLSSIAKTYESKNYKFLFYTLDDKYKTVNDSLLKKTDTYNSLGQEFDNVITYIDEEYTLDKENNLSLINKKADNKLYINITRARKKLCIVVINNKEVFKSLIELKTRYSYYLNDLRKFYELNN